MTAVQRVLVVSIVVAVASIAVAAIRLATSGDGASTAPERPRPAGAAEPEVDATDTDATPAQAPGEVRSARVNLRMGVPAPGPVTLRARVGDEIRITVTSSGAEDDVVVNGFGERAKVTPSRPARIRFVATRDGFYDVLLQTSGAKVADLDIQP